MENQILLSEINENNYSDRHLDFIDIENDHTYIIDKNKIGYIEVIPFSVFNQGQKEELQYQYLIFVGDNVFSFVSNVPEYYEPLLLGAKNSDNTIYKKSSELFTNSKREIDESLRIQKQLLAEIKEISQRE